MSRKRIADSVLIESAKKYTKRTDWANAPDYNLYELARTRGILDLCCKHMDTPIKAWTKDSILSEITKYKSWSDLKKNKSGLVHASKREGVLSDIKAYYAKIPIERIKIKDLDPKKIIKWDVNLCRDVLLKYNNKKELDLLGKKALIYARKMKMHKELTSHFSTAIMSNQEIIDKAKEFSTQNEWNKNHSKSYRLAKKRGILNECLAVLKGGILKKSQDKRRKEIEDLANQGASKEEIHKALNIKHGIISDYQKKFNIKINQSSIYISDEKKSEVINLFKSGMLVTEISKKTGRSLKSINKCLHGIRTINKHRVDIPELLRMNDSGVSVMEIAKHFSTDTGSVRHILNRRGKKGNNLPKSCKDNAEKIIEMVKNGKTQVEICRSLNLLSNSLHRFLTSQGLHKETKINYRYSRSSIETEVMEEFKKYNPIQSYRYIEKKRNEIDIYLPDYKIGIEICGVYWHRESYRGKTAHLEKLKECQKLGITLFTIFDLEWKKNKDLYVSIIKSKMAVSCLKIAARKCQIAHVNHQDASSFFKKYHLQGSPPNQTLSMGLFYNNELIGCMSFGKHHRDKNLTVLNRLAFKKDINIIGGSEKLFSHSVKALKESGVNKIITYSDNRLSEGRVYEKLNFFLEKELKPDYIYYKNGKTYSKQSMKKTKEERLTGKTEYELRKEQKFDRVWDCGKKRWVFLLQGPKSSDTI